MNKLEEIRDKLQKITSRFATLDALKSVETDVKKSVVKDLTKLVEKDLAKIRETIAELQKILDLFASLTEEKQRQMLFDIEAKLKEIEIFVNSLIETKAEELERFLQAKLSKTKKDFEEIIAKIEEEFEKLKKGEKELKTVMIGPSASGVEVQLNNQKEGVFSIINFEEGSGVAIEKTKEPTRGKINLTFKSAGADPTSSIIYAIALG